MSTRRRHSHSNAAEDLESVQSLQTVFSKPIIQSGHGVKSVYWQKFELS